MRILLVTQTEELYLPAALKLFLENLPEYVEISGCVLLAPSANGAGRGNSFLNRLKIALTVFGVRFSLNVATRLIYFSGLSGQTVKKIIKQHGISVIELKESINSESSVELLTKFSPDLIISIQGNEIFGKRFLEISPCLNLHTAPLPKYRGLMPTFWAMLNGERETAVSVFLVDEGIDSGPIYVQRPVAIENMSLHQAIIATKRQGMFAVIEALDMIRDGRDPEIINDTTEGSYHGFPARSDIEKFKRAGKKLF